MQISQESNAPDPLQTAIYELDKELFSFEETNSKQPLTYRSDIPCAVIRSRSTLRQKLLQVDLNQQLVKAESGLASPILNRPEDRYKGKASFKNYPTPEQVVAMRNNEKEYFRQQLNHEKQMRLHDRQTTEAMMRHGASLKSIQREQRVNLRWKTSRLYPIDLRWTPHWMAQIDFPHVPVRIPMGNKKVNNAIGK